jgi:hypothetical protein
MLSFAKESRLPPLSPTVLSDFRVELGAANEPVALFCGLTNMDVEVKEALHLEMAFFAENSKGEKRHVHHCLLGFFHCAAGA